MFKYLYITILFLLGCSANDSVDDVSKHNGNWMWHIKNNEREGKWIPVSDTGSFSIEDGKSIWWHDNGVKSFEGTKINGQKVGHWKAWYENGKLLEDLLYKNDTIFQYAWYENGNKKLQGALLKGKGTGQWYIWFDNGQLRKDILYRNDTAYQKQFYDNGQLLGIGTYYNHQSIGKLTRWYKNGNLMSITYWYNDIQAGPCIHYYENGNLQSQGAWEDGTSVGNWVYYNETKKQKIDSIVKYPEGIRLK